MEQFQHSKSTIRQFQHLKLARTKALKLHEMRECLKAAPQFCCVDLLQRVREIDVYLHFTLHREQTLLWAILSESRASCVLSPLRKTMSAGCQRKQLEKKKVSIVRILYIVSAFWFFHTHQGGSHLCWSVCDWDQNWIKRSRIDQGIKVTYELWKKKKKKTNKQWIKNT